MRSVVYFFLLLIVSALSQYGFVSPASPDTGKVRVMVLGSHFLPHDILRPGRQKEVAALVEGLARFSPDKVIVDVPAQSLWEQRLDEDYLAFLKGTHILNRSVREQIGFRLASFLGHTHLFGVDTEDGFNLGAYLSEVQADFHSPAVDMMVQTGRGIETAKQQHLNYGTLSSYFAYLNNPGNLSYEHGSYIKGLTQISNAGTASGTSILAEWYKYHMELLANLSRIVSPKDQKVIVIVDSGYAAVLHELIDADPRFEWEDPTQFLNIQ
ncbi:MAG: DUF5694 domain-containing protein [Bacteroidia bacterium]